MVHDRKQYMRDWWARNKDKRAAYQRAKNLRMRQWLDEQKDKPCMDCGGKFPPECMDFDHRPDEVKSFGISARIGSQMLSKAKFLIEMAKCDLVCANCHRIRTKKRLREGT